ncbi:Long chain fatty acid CoA ligase [Spironucleus salmonicida]|uniref:Long chain fatty acid CoA ligase n=1 Tax=Spironucleus salmonicida TaxID=348837 RepID=V6LH98_9EUKA|nr:Long chain fatty acid CoA ligase [Spironucleus salmonicida]|eukprot:EST43940.1 Long chain fatty acid CoA ligase [Spironucleus salmonicida]
MFAKRHDFSLHSQLELISNKEPNPNLTMVQAFQQMVTNYQDDNMLGSRNGLSGESKLTQSYRYLSFIEVEKYVQTLSFYLSQHINVNDRVAIFSKNCPMVWISELSVQYLNGVSVSLYDTLGDVNIQYCLEITQSKVIIIGKNQKQILENILPNLNYAPIVLDITYLEEYITTNQQNFNALCAKTADDTSNILFSSGTSGSPKAVLLTSRNMIAGGANMGYRFLDYQGIMLSYLPLAHVFEKNFEFLFMTRGGAIAFSSQGTKNLIQDIKLSGVTMLIGVPRVWQKIYNGVKSKTGPLWPIFVAFMYLKVFLMYLFPKYEKTGKTPIDIVFKPISKNFPKLTFVVSGSSAVSKQLRIFLQTCFCARLGTGYGLTETGANALYICGTMKYWDDNTLGFTTINTEVKIIPDDTGHYDLQKTKIGEICVKSNSVARFIIRDSYDNKICQLDSEDFYHTGDMGILNPDGSISFLRRKNLVIKLQQGEFLDLEKIEKIIEQIEGVEHAFVTAQPQDYAPVCIVLSTLQIQNLQEKIDIIVRKSGLKGFCVPKASKQLYGQEWLDNRDLFTPSAKKIHNGFQKVFDKDINELRQNCSELKPQFSKKIIAVIGVSIAVFFIYMK